MAPAAKAPEIATNAPEARGEGGLRTSFFPEGRKLAIEAAIIAGLVAVGAVAAYFITRDTIDNKRPVAGANHAVGLLGFDQSQYSFATTDGKTLVGASNDTGGEVLDIFASRDGGETWTRTDGPVVPGSCAHGAPQVAALPGGGEVVAFLGAPQCGRFQSLQPFLVTSTRATPTGAWTPIRRVVPTAWEYGFDDAPSLAASRDGKRVYLAWNRSYDKLTATIAVSTSTDGGATWSAPVQVSGALVHPHLVTTTVADDGTLYVAGIDAKHGLWATRSTDGGRTFAPPVAVAKLLGNQSASCAQTADQPLPRELRQCSGPDPTIVVQRDHVLIVYSDFAANQTTDIYVAGLDRSLHKQFTRHVSPPDTSKTQQFAPVAAVDATTGTAWACWYDTTYDPNAKRVWFTCSASHDGRRWTPPLAAASQESTIDDIF
ncbi:MAG: sialidase family protein, partial [Gaiellaceae bacterium]